MGSSISKVRATLSAVLCCIVFLYARASAAQDTDAVLPPSFAAADNAEGKSVYQSKTDDTVLQIIGGGNFNTGNTRSLLLTLGTRVLLKRGWNVFSSDAQAAFGQSAPRDDTTGKFGPWEKNTENLQGRIRYDRFFTSNDGAFLALGARRDPFAGLNVRLQGQTGYVRNLIQRDNLRFWGEAGYDLTYDDWFLYPAYEIGPNGEVKKTQTQHSGRLFFGYDNHVNEVLTLRTGLEGLYDLERSRNHRLNWTNDVLSRVAGNWQLGMQFALLYDNWPVPGARKLDTKTLLSLVYDLI